MSAADTLETRNTIRTTRSLILLTIFGLLALFFALNFRVVVVSGPSMEPTYKSGDRLLMTTAYWLFGDIQKGDVVVIVRPNGELLIKRVVALAGEQIPEKYWTPLVYMMGGRVPEGHIFVVGDNLERSEDSRQLGAIPLSYVQGKIVGGRGGAALTDWATLTAMWAGRQMRFVPDETLVATPRPCYVVVLISDGAGRYLLAHIRERGYCAPSGRIEPGESPDSAAIREAYEESGAVLYELHLLGHYLLEPCSVAEPEPCSAPVFLARAERLEPLQPESESQGVRWARLEEMPALYYDWSPLIETVFRYAEERRKALWER